MSESVFLRVRRLISASVEDAVDAMERAGGTGVMREAIREVDRCIDEVRAEHDGAASRRLQAIRQEKLFRERLAGFDEKARFALGQGREDLAAAAISRQIDFEAEAEKLKVAQATAEAETGRLQECLAALTSRRAQMEEALALFEASRREAEFPHGAAARPARATERRVERAAAAFDRVMTAATGAGGAPRYDADAAAKVATIETLQRSAVVAERLAALRAQVPA